MQTALETNSLQGRLVKAYMLVHVFKLSYCPLFLHAGNDKEDPTSSKQQTNSTSSHVLSQ